MSGVNHFTISSILHSEIVGRVGFGHGQIGALGDAQRYFDTLKVNESSADLHRHEDVDVHKVIKAFHSARNARGDRGSADLYVADPGEMSEAWTPVQRLPAEQDADESPQEGTFACPGIAEDELSL